MRRWHKGSDATLDDTHLIRLAGRFARRVRAWGEANGVPVVDCEAGERVGDLKRAGCRPPAFVVDAPVGTQGAPRRALAPCASDLSWC